MSTITNITQVNANIQIQNLSVNDNNELQEISGWHKFGRAIADTFRNLTSSGRAQIASRNEAVINKIKDLTTEANGVSFVDANTALSRLTEQKDVFKQHAIVMLGNKISKEIAKEFGEGSLVQESFTEKLDEIIEQMEADSELDFKTLADELHEIHKSLMGDESFFEEASSGGALEDAIKSTNRPMDREDFEWIDVNSSD